MLECQCCHLPRYPEPVSHTDRKPQVCPDCLRHYGNLQKRDADHIESWRAQYRLMRGALQGRIADLTRESETTGEALAIAKRELSDVLAAAAQNYANAPVGDVQRLVQSAVVKDAEKRTQAAYRARGRAMAAIWAIDEIHNDAAQSGKCSCGKATTRCREWQGIDGIRSEYYRWENDQLERLKDGRAHDLPAKHPEVLKRRGR